MCSDWVWFLHVILLFIRVKFIVPDSFNHAKSEFAIQGSSLA